MSQDTVAEQPRRRSEKRKDWNAFDLDMISCAKNQWAVDFYFITDIPLDSSGETRSHITGTVQVVDVYFLRISIPTEEGSQREVWIAKTAIAIAEAHKGSRKPENS